MVVHSLNPSAWEQRQGDLCEFKVSLVYKSRVKVGLYNETLPEKCWRTTEEDIQCQPSASTPLCTNAYLHSHVCTTPRYTPT